MLIHQGAVAFSLWTGLTAPVATMHQTFVRAMTTPS
jgi:shikimate 5-dehydrogenase